MARPRAGLRRRAAAGLVAVTAALGAAGCGGEENGAASASGSPSARTPAGSPAPAASTPPAAPAPPRAADGTNLRACKDGTCEVKVARRVTIAMDEDKLEVSAIKVTSLKGGEVSFDVALPSSGAFDLNCEGDPRCQTMVAGPAFGSAGNAKITAHPGARIKANGVVITVVAAAGGTAVLRMEPR
ncbi:hypothetical protein ETD83_12635 [Actinomadura soli]|uniref:Uncharacterized protein n=1 Tax=Actinomadura soli TaxID=2508997 RepID=A0A5C4JDP1_9ACTN|nr:hypothetical protein [Actinomadura soli]TMR02389.1 hypothetical protein ETD83_12635 [Actinomadura soli]